MGGSIVILEAIVFVTRLHELEGKQREVRKI